MLILNIFLLLDLMKYFKIIIRVRLLMIFQEGLSQVLLKTDILHLFRCTLMLLSIKEHMKFYKEFRKIFLVN